jgi:SAM-dependent methyltransferase
MMYSVQRTVAAVLKAVLPGAMVRKLQLWRKRAAIRRLLVWPPVGTVVSHDLLCRTTPISREYGADRGTTIDRYYIESFLSRHSGDVRGTVLEIHNDTYTQRFGKERVTRSEVLSISPGSKVTIIADLTSADHIPSNTFNCIILTQTLQYIYDLPAAAATIYRILAHGGVLLATVPGICCLGPEVTVWPCYWGFRPESLRKLITDAFPERSVSVKSAGNVLAAVAFLHGLALEEVNRVALDAHDSAYPVILSVRAVK